MNRRDFFRRSGERIAGVAVVATPLSLFAARPPENGRLVVDGREVSLTDADVANGIEIHATGPVSIVSCDIRSTGYAVKADTSPLFTNRPR